MGQDPPFWCVSVHRSDSPPSLYHDGEETERPRLTVAPTQNDRPPILRRIKGMHSALRNDFGIRYAAFNEKRTKWLRLNDFIPGFDRLEQLRVLSAHGFPEYVFGGSNILAPQIVMARTPAGRTRASWGCSEGGPFVEVNTRRPGSSRRIVFILKK
jgi:hypothetical protein